MALQLPPGLGNLLKIPENVSRVVQKGSIVNFRYVGQTRVPIKDAYPLVLVSDIFTNAIRGINLNFLDSPYVKSMILNYLNKPFSYAFIKNDHYIVDAFRTYKRNGISQLRIMDSNFLIGLAKVARSLNVNEIDQVRQQIAMVLKEQLKQPVAQPGPIK